MCRGFLLYRFWRILPGIFLEDFLGAFQKTFRYLCRFCSLLSVAFSWPSSAWKTSVWAFFVAFSWPSSWVSFTRARRRTVFWAFSHRNKGKKCGEKCAKKSGGPITNNRRNKRSAKTRPWNDYILNSKAQIPVKMRDYMVVNENLGIFFFFAFPFAMQRQMLDSSRFSFVIAFVVSMLGFHKPQPQATPTTKNRIPDIFFRFRFRNPTMRKSQTHGNFLSFARNCFCEDGSSHTALREKL